MWKYSKTAGQAQDLQQPNILARHNMRPLLHQKALDLFGQYRQAGGLPEVTADWIEKQDGKRRLQMQRALIASHPGRLGTAGTHRVLAEARPVFRPFNAGTDTVVIAEGNGRALIRDRQGLAPSRSHPAPRVHTRQATGRVGPDGGHLIRSSRPCGRGTPPG